MRRGGRATPPHAARVRAAACFLPKRSAGLTRRPSHAAAWGPVVFVLPVTSARSRLRAVFQNYKAALREKFATAKYATSTVR